MQTTKLAYAGLDNIFERLFISGEIGISKPDAEIFLMESAWAKALPNETMMVGDHPDLDIRSAASLCRQAHQCPNS